MYFWQYTFLKTVVDILLEGKSPLNIVGLYTAHSIKDIRGSCKCDLYTVATLCSQAPLLDTPSGGMVFISHTSPAAILSRFLYFVFHYILLTHSVSPSWRRQWLLKRLMNQNLPILRRMITTESYTAWWYWWWCIAMHGAVQIAYKVEYTDISKHSPIYVVV